MGFTKGPEWDPEKYPDPDAMVKELKDLNIKLMVSVWPEVRNKPLEEKYGLKKIEGSNFIDIYDKEVAKQFYNVLSDSMFKKGVSSIWLDGTEPEGVHNTNVSTAVGTYTEVQNPYSLEVTRAVYEGRREEFPNERVFNLTRSAYSGQQRYGAASWSGDVEASWEQFSEQIPAGLNFIMAGIPYWTHDIGGFFRDSKSINREFDSQYTNPEYIELLTRWFQFGTFSPLFRIHGYVSETEIWRYNEEFETTARKFIDLRYQSIMVGFVTEYQKREKSMYFPKGDWYNYWTNEKIEGGKDQVVKAELNETPMFVKAGSIIPIGPKVQYATQKTETPLLLKIYPGKDAEYTLYFDDNESYDYEKGAYSEIQLRYSEANKTLELKKGTGDYINFKENSLKFVVEMIGNNDTTLIEFSGEVKSINLN